jgi:tetratricopeptide (TPR) repeat protein
VTGEERIDVNAAMAAASSLRETERNQEAIELYLFLADGDASLDAGWLAVQLAECYESLGRLSEARYWAGRAEEENPTLWDRVETRNRLGPVKIDHILPRDQYLVSKSQ